MFGLLFRSMANYLARLENSPKDWHLAPIRGHTQVHKLFPLYPADLAILDTHGIITVFQLFETHLSKGLNKSISAELLILFTPYPSLQQKPRVLTRAFIQKPFHNKYASSRSNLATFVDLDINLSWKYQLKCRELLDSSIGVAPACHTRVRGGIAYNTPHPSILLYVTDKKTTHNTQLHPAQEIKRDGIHRRMNLQSVRKITNPQRIISTLLFIGSNPIYVQYIGTVKYAKALETLLQLQDGLS